MAGRNLCQRQTAQRLGKSFCFQGITPPPDLISFAESNPYLILDTSLFPPEFQTRLLSALSDSQSLDTATDGLLIHSDNFQALNLLQARYREQVKCIYIDPPYNTEEDRAKGKFIYKDGFPSSSWATLVHNRLCLSKNLLQQSGVIYQSIDDNEQTRLKLITDNLLGEKNFLADMIILTGANQSGEGVNIQVNNEYCLAHALNKDKVKIYHIDEVNETLRNLNDAPTPLHTRVDMGYTIYFNPNTQDLIPLMDYDKDKIYLNDEKQVYKNNENLINQGYIPIRAGKRSNFLHRWRWGFDSFIERKDEIIIRKSKDKYNVFFKQFGFNAPKNIINVSSGTVELKNIFSGNSIFSNPKNTSLIHRLVSFSTNKTDLILDYFAGSGTTAHAVINLNREDGGKRKYILVEQGEYFNTVLKPRIEKAVYSAEWKDGKPVADKDSGSLNGISQMVKVLKLESYEDTLNNLVLQNKGDLLSGLPESAQQDYLLHYMLDVESRDSLLSTDAFQKPFAYCLNIAADSAGAYDSTPVDLVETFNYLLGLRVQAVEDKRFSEGYVLVEGWLKHPNEKILVVWRDCEIWGYDRLPELLKKKRVNPQDSEYDAVYINGDHTLPTAWQSDDGLDNRSLKIMQIEAEFLRLMFAEA